MGYLLFKTINLLQWVLEYLGTLLHYTYTPRYSNYNIFIDFNQWFSEANFVSYKTMSLKMVQESYRICNWLMEKQCSDMDNIFDINTYVDKIVCIFQYIISIIQ